MTTRERPFSLYTPTDTGPTAAVPSADSKSAVVSQSRVTFEEEAERNAIRHQTARWLTNLLGKDFPVERVYPGHVENYLAWVRAHGR